jgi:magnesium transporter
MFSVLEPEKAAETLLEAEPRAQRQIVEDLSSDRASEILSEMSAAQAADLLSALPWEDRMDLLKLMPADKSARVHAILATDEKKAGSLMSNAFVAMPRQATVADALLALRASERAKEEITYIYVVDEPSNVLLGAVDLRELVLAPEIAILDDIMSSPAVSADQDLAVDDLVELFDKYQFRLLPVVDAGDHLLGVVSYKDMMR